MPEGHQGPAEHDRGTAVASLLQALQAGLADADESARYRALASLLGGWAEQCRPGANGPGAAAVEQLKALSHRLQESEQKRANLEDSLRTTQADLARREKQLEAEQIRAAELEATLAGQRGRLEAAQKEVSTLESQLVDRNSELSAAESEKERLHVRLQRAQLESGDRSQLEALEEGKRQLAAQVDGLRQEMEQLRRDKNAEIDRLRSDSLQLQAAPSQGADALLTAMWDRLASASPPLAHGGVQPTVQAGERLVDACIELVGFVYRFDQDMRMFLNKYTKHHPAVAKPWKVYADRDDFHQIIQQAVEPTGSRNVGILKMKLKVCQKWAFAAMVSADSIMESLASELQAHLMGEAGAGSDPRCTVRDYLRKNGPDLFLEHMLKLRGQKLAEVYGFGV